MRYLITGGAGFTGSHLVDALTTRGDDVLVLDDLSTGTVENPDERQRKTEDARSHRERRFAPSRSAAGSVDLIEARSLNEALVDDCIASVESVSTASLAHPSLRARAIPPPRRSVRPSPTAITCRRVRPTLSSCGSSITVGPPQTGAYGMVFTRFVRQA